MGSHLFKRNQKSYAERHIEQLIFFIPDLQAASDLTQSPAQNKLSPQSMTHSKYSSAQSDPQRAYASDDGHENSSNMSIAAIKNGKVIFNRTILKVMMGGFLELVSIMPRMRLTFK